MSSQASSLSAFQRTRSTSSAFVADAVRSTITSKRGRESTDRSSVPWFFSITNSEERVRTKTEERGTPRGRGKSLLVEGTRY